MKSKDFGHGILYQGDCLDIMPQAIPEKSVDMILADLPYETTDCHWDRMIPLKDYFSECDRILKINGVATLFAQPPFTYVLGVSNLKEYRHSWVWIKDKSCDVLAAPYKPQKRTEDILVFSPSGFAHNSTHKCTYNPQMIESDGYKRKSLRGVLGKSITAIKNRPETSWKAMKIRTRTEYEGRFPVNYVYFPVPYGENRLHPTQKPVELFQYLILTYTNKGDIVLDNVIGSGTTAIAAYNTGRKWIGIEKDPDIFDMACERIERETKQQNIFN